MPSSGRWERPLNCDGAGRWQKSPQGRQESEKLMKQATDAAPGKRVKCQDLTSLSSGNR